MNSSATIFGKSTCQFTLAAERALPTAQVFYLDQMTDGEQMHADLIAQFKQRTVPYIFIQGTFVGGYDDLQK